MIKITTKQKLQILYTQSIMNRIMQTIPWRFDKYSEDNALNEKTLLDILNAEILNHCSSQLVVNNLEVDHDTAVHPMVIVEVTDVYGNTIKIWYEVLETKNEDTIRYVPMGELFDILGLKGKMLSDDEQDVLIDLTPNRVLKSIVTDGLDTSKY